MNTPSRHDVTVSHSTERKMFPSMGLFSHSRGTGFVLQRLQWQFLLYTEHAANLECVGKPYVSRKHSFKQAGVERPRHHEGQA
eukprot:1671805-Amphidinium_carterae.1